VTIICEPSADQAQSLAAEVGGTVFPVSGLHAVNDLLSTNPDETVVVLGAGVDIEQALDFTAWLRQQRPTVGAILVRDSLEVADLTRAIRAGVREVVQSDDREALLDACRRYQQVFGYPPVPNTPSPRGHVVTVFSAKGGCGKTTLAINIATSLAQAGQRVCLVDLDLSFGDVAISLQLDPKRTIADALGLGDHLDEAKVASLLTPYRPGFDCMLAPTGPGDAERIPVALTSGAIAVLSAMYDYVVVDTPSQLTEHVLAALDASHQHVLITTPEVPALKNLRLTLDMLDLLSYERSTRAVVLNRSDANVGLSQADVERVVKSPVAGHVPSSREVPVSINKGVPLVDSSPDHPVSVAVRQFVAGHVHASVDAPQPVRSGRSVFRLRRRSA
jgi:pilus assembly protein CpaE